MAYKPSRIVVPDKICIYRACGYRPSDNYFKVDFSKNTEDPPANTLAIVPNEFDMRGHIGGISQGTGNYYARIYLDNALPFSDGCKAIRADVKWWALNDMIMNGLIKKGGVVDSDLVVVVYGGHSSLIAKSGEVYQELTK